MLKSIITILTILFSASTIAQTENKILQVDIRGVSCHGGSGLCSIISSEASKTFSSNSTISKQKINTIVLEIEINKLSIEEQNIYLGKEYSKVVSNEKLFFIQDADFFFNEKTLDYLNIDPKYDYIKKGSYPIQIINNKALIEISLSN